MPGLGSSGGVGGIGGGGSVDPGEVADQLGASTPFKADVAAQVPVVSTGSVNASTGVLTLVRSDSTAIPVSGDVRGPKGDTGNTGPAGRTIHPLTPGQVPTGALGVDGDFAIDSQAGTTTPRIYGPKASGVWPAPRGLQGPQGDQGIQGNAGAPGRTIHPLADGATPAPGLGADGDFALDNAVALQKLYGPKAAGAWPAARTLTGAQGIPGNPGADGEPGSDGAPGEVGPAGNPGPEGRPSEPPGGGDLHIEDDGIAKKLIRYPGESFAIAIDDSPPLLDLLSPDLAALGTPMTGYRWTLMPSGTGAPANTYALEATGGGQSGIASPAGISTIIAGRRTPIRETANSLNTIPVGRHRFIGNFQRLGFGTAPAAAAIGDTITATGGKSGTIIAIDGNSWTIYRTTAFANGDSITGPGSYTGTITSLTSFSAIVMRINPARAETTNVDPRSYADGYFVMVPNTSLPLRTNWLPFTELRQPTWRAFTPQTATGAILGWDPGSDYSGLPRTTVTTTSTAVSQGAGFQLRMPDNLDFDGPCFFDIVCRSTAVTFAARTIDLEVFPPPAAGGALTGDLVLTPATALNGDTVLATYRFTLISITEAIAGRDMLARVTAAISNIGGTAGQDGYIEIAAMGLTYMRRG